MATPSSAASTPSGTASDGGPYRADDPELLTWVRTDQVRGFLAVYPAYAPRRSRLTPPQCDAYLAQVAPVAEALGAQDVPHSVREADCSLTRVRPPLQAAPAALDCVRFLRGFGRTGRERLGAHLLMNASIGLLAEWARAGLGLGRPAAVRSGWDRPAAMAVGVVLQSARCLSEQGAGTRSPAGRCPSGRRRPPAAPAPAASAAPARPRATPRSSRPPPGHAPGRACPRIPPGVGRAAKQAGPRDDDETPGAPLRAGRRTAGALCLPRWRCLRRHGRHAVPLVPLQIRVRVCGLRPRHLAPGLQETDPRPWVTCQRWGGVQGSHIGSSCRLWRSRSPVRATIRCTATSQARWSYSGVRVSARRRALQLLNFPYRHTSSAWGRGRASPSGRTVCPEQWCSAASCACCAAAPGLCPSRVVQRGGQPVRRCAPSSVSPPPVTPLRTAAAHLTTRRTREAPLAPPFRTGARRTGRRSTTVRSPARRGAAGRRQQPP